LGRIRALKPGFFYNEELADLGHAAMLLFAGLWCIADRDGRLEDRPRRIRAQVFPYDSTKVSNLLDKLQKSGFITRYSVNGGDYIQIQNWLTHQKPHHTEKESLIPQCDKKTVNNGCLTEHSLREHSPLPINPLPMSEEEEGGIRLSFSV